MAKKQYRIVESRAGSDSEPFYQVEVREREWAPSYIFQGFWSEWSSFGETASIHGYGEDGLTKCRRWIKVQRIPMQDRRYHYNGRVVYTEDVWAISTAQQFLQQMEQDNA